MSNQSSVAKRVGQRSQKATGTNQKKVPLRLARQTVLAGRGLVKKYYKKNVEIPVLHGVDLEIREGEFTAIVGKSGSGKSTLMHLLATLDKPDQGEVWYQGDRIDNLSSGKREKIRNQDFGMIFQFYHLLPELTMLENVLVPQMIGSGVFSYLKNRRKFTNVAKELLDLVGLSHRMTHKPSQLSGGEMQRAAIARALVTEPKMLLADEPTGNLDAENGSEVLDILLKLNQEKNLSILMVTHDTNIAAKADQLITMVDGRIQ